MSAMTSTTAGRGSPPITAQAQKPPTGWYRLSYANGWEKDQRTATVEVHGISWTARVIAQAGAVQYRVELVLPELFSRDVLDADGCFGHEVGRAGRPWTTLWTIRGSQCFVQRARYVADRNGRVTAHGYVFHDSPTSQQSPPTAFAVTSAVVKIPRVLLTAKAQQLLEGAGAQAHRQGVRLTSQPASASSRPTAPPPPTHSSVPTAGSHHSASSQSSASTRSASSQRPVSVEPRAASATRPAVVAAPASGPNAANAAAQRPCPLWQGCA